MSHTVVRGKPNAAQLHLDTVLDDILTARGVEPGPEARDTVTLSEILYHCLKERPNDLFMINGATGEKFTNEQVLGKAVSLARALKAQGARGKHALLLMRNHQDMVTVYFGVLFSGVVPFMIDPNSTTYELTYFVKLIEPAYVFCDQEFSESLHEALTGYEGQKPQVLVADKPEELNQFSKKYGTKEGHFEVSAASMDDTAMFLPTSGSTGLPKAVMQSHRGLVAQLPTPWSYHTQFPTPTSRVMILTTIQWMTFTMLITASTVYHVPIIISPKKNTPQSVAELLQKYRPTWTFMAPAFATSLVPVITPDHLSSLETLVLLGAPSTTELLDALREKLPKSAHLSDSYGTTETHGFIAMPDRAAPLKSNGYIDNFLYYKIVDDDGKQLGLNQSGELYVSGVSVVKGYYKNEAAYKETFTPDGWYKTGDVFHVDEHERVAFIARKKFSFKFQGSQVSPEEVEQVISSVPGVHESAVCATDKGPAAAVVLEHNARLSRDQIHRAVNSCLSEHKRLHGGIAFVTSLPYTHSGKLKRKECSELIAELINTGHCF
ncbi:probable 4-coumarate--CoA ligase 1 [Trichoplusia ni]|uniref:Probable 4-coumarate--CoA ligase 1 n=1 Tax=Trichoplusia ni TaxID=7111 RepID=A0A7E5WIJ2_TRINI|nr:probable 4-coumarate--CoA ligase 1 [Trichoplusia ni]XP_026740515.1 probable 4-coumarate--CoA ligase 1 [Trichoplusia ni]XP_026740516.1 probable 4-coumarate--CoA ligase 1 [Trichoplusia ni]